MEKAQGIIRAEGATDVGLKRKVNQDNFHVDQARQLFIIADGMGGHKAGDTASQVAVSEILAYLQSEAEDEKTPTGVELDELKRLTNSLIMAIQTANRKICTMARENRDYFGMGTTIVVMWVLDEQFVVAHVGDSRLYRLRHGVLEPMTKDHSRVQELIDMEKLTEAEAEHYPGRNVITRALGGDLEIKVDTAAHQIDPLDAYLLCTDGLSGVVPSDIIREMMMLRRGSPALACKQLIEAAKRHGAPDNVTVIVLEGKEVVGAAEDDATMPLSSLTGQTAGSPAGSESADAFPSPAGRESGADPDAASAPCPDGSNSGRWQRLMRRLFKN